MRRWYVIEYKDRKYYVIQAENGSEVMVRNGFVYEWGCSVWLSESLESCMARFLRQANVIERTRLPPGAKEALERYPGRYGVQ